MNRFRKRTKPRNSTPTPKQAVPSKPKPEDKEADAGKRPEPKRQFSQGPPTKPPSQLGLKLQEVAFWLVPLLVFLAILFGGLIAVLVLSFTQTEEAAAPEVVSVERTSRPVLLNASPQRILQNYLEAVGGTDAVRDVNSLRFDGELVDALGEGPCTVLFKRPDLGMLSIEDYNARKQRRVFNGDKAWLVLNREGGRETVRLAELDRQALLATCRFIDPVMELAAFGRGVVLIQQENKFGDRNAIQLKIEGVDGRTIDCFLDRGTLYLIGTRETIIHEGETHTIEVRRSDFRMSSGVVWPYEIEVRLDGELYHRITFNSNRVNSGVMSTVFEVPDLLTD